MKIVAFDPGGTVGMAVGSIFGQSLIIERVKEYQLESFHKVLPANLRGMSEVLIERPFNSGQHLDMSGFEAYGFIKHYSLVKTLKVVDRQPNVMVFADKRFPTIELRGHWGDAARHLMVYAYDEFGVRDVRYDFGVKLPK